jgi:putative membrane protein
MMMNGWMYGWMYGWMWIWPLLVLAGLLLLVYGVVRLAQGSPSVPGDVERGSSARRILDERFARGEIDEDDYRRRRAELS